MRLPDRLSDPLLDPDTSPVRSTSVRAPCPRGVGGVVPRRRPDPRPTWVFGSSLGNEPESSCSFFDPREGVDYFRQRVVVRWHSLGVTTGLGVSQMRTDRDGFDTVPGLRGPVSTKFLSDPVVT